MPGDEYVRPKMKEVQYPVVIEYDPDNDVYLADRAGCRVAERV